MGLYGQWRGFREFAAECAEVTKSKEKIYKETPISAIDDKWKKAASKIGFIKPKPKRRIYNQKPKPKLNELFGRNKEKNEKLPTLYESYRPGPKLKSALKKTSSFGPQGKIIRQQQHEQQPKRPKQLTPEQLTPHNLFPKPPERTVLSFSDKRFSHFSSYPNDLSPSLNRDWMAEKTKSY
jgi:hypothetical protein